jgi:hypothetical protein
MIDDVAALLAHIVGIEQIYNAEHNAGTRNEKHI